MPRPTWDNLDQRRRERVLHAAMAEFGRRGYSGGSLNVIAREADVAKGSLFQYFEDKFDFFAHVAEQTSLTVYAAMAPNLTGPRDGESFLAYFTRLVDAWMDYMASHPLERAETTATNMELDPEIRKVIRAPVHRLYAQALRPMLEEAQASGDLAADADIDALLAVLIILLPHLALAPFEPGLDAALPLYDQTREVRSERAARMVATVFASALVDLA
jgi:AcrR family transcriptional regulator